MKIVSVKEAGSWESQYGTMFDQVVELSDGTSGTVSAKTLNRWKVGDEVEIKSKSSNKHGVKLKLSVPNPDYQGGSQTQQSSSNSSNNRLGGFIASWVKKLVVAGKIDPRDTEDVCLEYLEYVKEVDKEFPGQGSVVVSYSNDLYAADIITKDQVLGTAKRWAEVINVINSKA